MKNNANKTTKMYRISPSTRARLEAAVARVETAVDVALDQGGLTPAQLGALRRELNAGNRLMAAARGVVADGFTMRRIKNYVAAAAIA